MKHAPDPSSPQEPGGKKGEVLPPATWSDPADAGQSRPLIDPAANSVWGRVFDIGPAGWVRLGIGSLAVGLIVRASELNVFSGDFNIPDALGSIVTAIAGMFAWAIANGWAPFAVGALIVMPVFVIWRFVAMPFRSRSPGAPRGPRTGARWGR